jgi:hypothetical protein
VDLECQVDRVLQVFQIVQENLELLAHQGVQGDLGDQDNLEE